MPATFLFLRGKDRNDLNMINVSSDTFITLQSLTYLFYISMSTINKIQQQSIIVIFLKNMSLNFKVYVSVLYENIFLLKKIMTRDRKLWKEMKEAYGL